MLSKGLDESRQIELAQMVDFMEEDESYLEDLLEEAGIGQAGDYEKFRISMARYLLNSARQYLEDVVNTWLAKDFKNGELIDVPMTIVTPEKIVRVAEKVTTTTVTDDKGKVSTAEVLPPTPKSETKTTTKENKPWIPAYKDEDKIKKVINEILDEVPNEERNRAGFQGWLAGSATAALGGKTEPSLMLEKVREVLATV